MFKKRTLEDNCLELNAIAIKLKAENEALREQVEFLKSLLKPQTKKADDE